MSELNQGEIMCIKPPSNVDTDSKIQLMKAAYHINQEYYFNIKATTLNWMLVLPLIYTSLGFAELVTDGKSENNFLDNMMFTDFMRYMPAGLIKLRLFSSVASRHFMVICQDF